MTVESGLLDSDERDDYEYSDESHERDDEDYDGDDVDDDDEDSEDDGDERSSTTEQLEALRKELDQYKNRFSGASRKINELLQEKDSVTAQTAQERYQLMMALMQEKVKDLDPEEQQQKLKQFDVALRQQMQLYFQEHQSRQQQEQLGPILKQMSAQRIAAEYGVPEEELMQFRDPEDMRIHARTISENLGERDEPKQTKKRNRQRNKPAEQQPRRNRRTQFDSPEPVAARRKKIETVDDAEKELLRLVKNSRRSTV
jgi:hypothetical protein